MAIASLSKFTVPIATDQNAGAQGLLMPKLKYRFRVTLNGFGPPGAANDATEITKQVMDVTRPTIAFDPIVIDVYNSRINLAGKHTWTPITLNVRDDVNGGVSKLVGLQLQKQFDFFEQASAASGIDYKFKANIEILDGGNSGNTTTVLEKWEVYGCYLENVNYNNLAYNANEPVNITMSIKYDNALQFGKDGSALSGVGEANARNNSGSGSATGAGNLG
jgi:hypothetical protein